MAISSQHLSSPLPAVDFDAIKQRQQRMWGSGDYAAVGVSIQYISEHLVEAAGVHAGQRVLDVATGGGNAAIAAARRFAEVIGLDYVPSLLERAEERAAAERLAITWVEGDAEALPFPDARFDVVLSAVGVMFAPNQPRAAGELLRVCRPGGIIALANWTPDGMIGEMLRVVGRFVPPPAGLQPPTRWGSEDALRELLGDGAEVRVTRREHLFRFRSPEHFADFFLTHYGPTERAFAAIGPDAQADLRRALEDLVARWNTASDGTVVSPGTYLEAVATRR